MLSPLLDGEPTAIDDFELLAHLSRGGFADVYVSRLRGRLGRLEQFAALKLLKYSLDDRDCPPRFLAEKTATRRIESAFIPKFLEDGVTSRRSEGVNRQYPWVATQLIAGLPLNMIIKRCGALREDLVWHLGAGIVTAIADMHASNWLHRDLKPDNVLVAINGPWVIDLSLAHLMGTQHLTTSRLMLGPQEYAPLEWWQGGAKASGPSADIYGLGAVLLYAATGHGPYRAGVDRIHIERYPPDLDKLPTGALGELIRSCLVREEADRPDDAGELRAQFLSHTGDVGREAFPEVLPEQVHGVMVEHLRKLARVTKTWGPAELGWGLGRRQTGAAPLRKELVQGRKRRDLPSAVGQATSDLVLPGAPASRRVAPVLPSPTLSAEWSVTWTCEVESWIRGPLAVHGDMVIVASLDGSVAAVNTRDGTPLTEWAVRTGAALHAGPLIVPDGARRAAAYVGDAAGFVRGIDLLSGRDDVVLKTSTAIEGTPVAVRSSILGVDDSLAIGDWLFALTADGWLHSVDLRTGESTVLYRMGIPATGTLATSSGLIFAAGTDGSVHAIDAITGVKAWPPLATDGQVLTAPLARASWLYVAGTDGVLRQIAIEDGQEAAAATVGPPVHCAPVADPYRVYVAGGDGVVRAYDLSHPNRDRWEPVWKSDVHHEVAGLAVTPNRVYASAGHHLVELDSATGGRTREPFPMDSLIATAPVISGRNCYVASLGGVVTCLSLDLISARSHY
jgi:outer membrane protein assembly factor BamB